MKVADLAYTAGIIDGEGCIFIRKSSSRSCSAGYQYSLGIHVVNTDKVLVDWLRLNHGGNTYCNSRTKAGNKVWLWRIHAKQASEFLEAVSPFLLLKRNQAKIGIEFQANKHVTGYYNARRAKTTDEQGKDVGYFKLMKDMHRVKST